MSEPERPAEESAPSRRPRRSITVSLLAVLSFVGLVPLVLLGYQVATRQANHLADNHKEALLDRARLLALSVQQDVEQHFARLEALAEALSFLPPEAEDVAEPSETDRARAFLDRYVQPERRFLALLLYGADSDRHDLLVNSQQFDPELLATAELRRELDLARSRGRRGTTHLSTPFVPLAGAHGPIGVFSVPLRGGALGQRSPRSVDGVEEGRAVLVAVVDMVRVQALVGEDGRSLHGFTTFVMDARRDDATAQGGTEDAPRVVAHTDFSVVTERQDLTDHWLVARFLKHGTTAASFESPPGPDGQSSFIGSYVPIRMRGHDWGVFVQVDRAEGLFQVHQMRQQTVFWGSVAFGLAVVLGLLFAWRITGPIQQLTEFTRRVTSGEYGRKVSVRSKNELGLLADNFNVMSEEISQTITDLRRQKEINDELFLSSIRSLAAAIDARDPYTRGHSERVRIYSRIISRQLGLSPAEMRTIEIGALLHDVGKIGIEDRILRKPAALTPEEFEIMKTHPAKGGEIMAPIPSLHDATDIIVHHHERFEGNGYPSGLAGEAIPLGARIVNVADTFDAMTTNRPYQRAMTFSVAAKKIESFSGKACDPEVVRAFLQAMDAGHFGQLNAESRAS